MRKILVSECLYGGRIVRYDARDACEQDPRFLQWKKEERLIPVCPEVSGGLPVPRPGAQRVGGKVLTTAGNDFTAEFTRGAQEAVRLAQLNNVAFAIMKQSSPSCGSKLIYDGSFTGTKVPGQGLTVELLHSAGIRVFSEEDLDEAETYLRLLDNPR
jgi:uncharacterized protein YbbK (DUF523 family)